MISGTKGRECYKQFVVLKSGTKGREWHKQFVVWIDRYLPTKLRGITPKKTKVIKFAFCIVYGEHILTKCHVRFVAQNRTEGY